MQKGNQKHNVTRHIISSDDSPWLKLAEKFSHLETVMQQEKWYIKDAGDFMNKIKKLQNILDGAILVIADVVGL